MKSIGFIDYYLDEWHANNYPTWFKESSFGREMELRYAWGMQSSPSGISSALWAKQNNATLLGSIEEVVERSDYLIVLSPDNPELHEELARLPLASGKPTYIDKPFAPDLSTGYRIVQAAKDGGTPFFSSSALRFAGEVATLKQSLGEKPLEYLSTSGGNTFHLYAIHQIEMLVAIVGRPALRVMQSGTRNSPQLIIDFSGGTRASMQVIRRAPFRLSAVYGDSETTHCAKVDNGFFHRLIEAMGLFFTTRVAPFNIRETLYICAIFDAAIKALEEPFQWIDVEPISDLS